MADGVVFLPSYFEAIKQLPDNDRLNACDAILHYGLYDEVIDMTPTVRMLFALIRPTIDSSQNRYRAAKENGKKGGRPRKNQTINQNGNQSSNQTNNQDKDIEMDSDSDIDSDKESDFEKEQETDKRLSPAPPTRAEVELFLYENKIFINPDRFYGFCEEIGWGKIWDWRNLAKNWDKGELKKDSNELFLEWRLKARERGLIHDD